MVIHLGVALLAIMLTASTAVAQEKAKIYLGASSKTLGYSPLWVATKKGFFEQQGLDVQLVLLRRMPMTVQALAAGSLHFGSGGPEPYIEAAERGLDFVITGGVINGTAQFIIAGKNYKSLRRFTRRDLWHGVFNRRHHHRIARSIEGQGA